MPNSRPDARWYHLVLFTYRRRPVFKLAKHALFCERTLIRTGKRVGWPVDSARTSDCSVHLLIKIPANISASRIALTIKWRCWWALVRRGMHPIRRRLWSRSYWCVPLTCSRSAAAVRHHIQQRMVAPRANPIQSILNRPTTNGPLSPHHPLAAAQSLQVSVHREAERRAPSPS